MVVMKHGIVWLTHQGCGPNDGNWLMINVEQDACTFNFHIQVSENTHNLTVLAMSVYLSLYVFLFLAGYLPGVLLLNEDAYY